MGCARTIRWSRPANNNGYPGADGKPKGDPNAASPITFDEFKQFVAEYTADKVSQLSGVPKDKLEALAKLYADPKTKVVSYWTMGFNQHTRGTWANNMVYNCHLLVGKISEPGNGPFSITGQPSACGTAREVGTFSHRLPADMVVMNPKHREIAEHIWKLPAGTIPGQAGLPCRAAGSHAEGWQAQFLLDLVHQQHAGRSEHKPRSVIRASAIPTTSSWSPTPTRRLARSPPT